MARPRRFDRCCAGIYISTAGSTFPLHDGDLLRCGRITVERGIRPFAHPSEGCGEWLLRVMGMRSSACMVSIAVSYTTSLSRPQATSRRWMVTAEMATKTTAYRASTTIA